MLPRRRALRPQEFGPVGSFIWVGLDLASTLVKLYLTKDDRGARVEANKRLTRIGGSVMVSIPPQMLKEMGAKAGEEVRLTSEAGRITIEPVVEQPSADVVEFAKRFSERYAEAMRNLARR